MDLLLQALENRGKKIVVAPIYSGEFYVV